MDRVSPGSRLPGPRGMVPDWLAPSATLRIALEYLAVDPHGARWAGRRRRELRSSGQRHPLADALIAAAAWRAGATVVTRNSADLKRLGVPVLGYGNAGQARAGTKRGSTP